MFHKSVERSYPHSSLAVCCKDGKLIPRIKINKFSTSRTKDCSFDKSIEGKIILKNPHK